MAAFGTFDAVFCSGLLYHLPKPWELLKEIGLVSGNVFIWTHYARPEEANKTVNGYHGYEYREFNLADPLSGLSKLSFRVTRGSLMDMLVDNSFHNTGSTRIIGVIPTDPASRSAPGSVRHQRFFAMAKT